MKMKKVPLRKCIACGERKEKKELIRVVKNNEGEVALDETGKLNGRGAYLCRTIECLDNVRDTHKLDRVLKTKVNDEVYLDIKSTLE